VSVLDFPAEIRRWITVGILIAVLCLVMAAVSMCRARDDANIARAGKTIADARTAASADANDIRDAAEKRTSEIETIVENTTDEIRKAATPADRERAATLGLCRIDPGSSPECRVLLADPR